LRTDLLQIAKIDHDVIELSIGYLGLCNHQVHLGSVEDRDPWPDYYTHKHLHVFGFRPSSSILPLHIHII
jgi:hypothetical protein